MTVNVWSLHYRDSRLFSLRNALSGHATGTFRCDSISKPAKLFRVFL